MRNKSAPTPTVAVTATLTILLFAFAIAVAMAIVMSPVSAGHTPLDKIRIEPGEVYNTTLSIYPPPSAEEDQVNITLSPSIQDYVTLSRHKFNLNKPQRVLVTVSSNEEVNASGYIIVEHDVGDGTGNVQITPLDTVRVSINVSRETEEQVKSNEGEQNKNAGSSSAGGGGVGGFTESVTSSSTNESTITKVERDGIQYKIYAKTPKPTSSPSTTPSSANTSTTLKTPSTHSSSGQDGLTIPGLTNLLLVAAVICIASAYAVFRVICRKSGGEALEEPSSQKLEEQKQEQEQEQQEQVNYRQEKSSKSGFGRGSSEEVEKGEENGNGDRDGQE